MENTYSGYFNLSKTSAFLEQIGVEWAIIHYGSITLFDDKLLIKIAEKEYGLLKSEISRIEKRFGGRFRIIHTNSKAPSFLIFSTFHSSDFTKQLKSSGYLPKD